jgi:bifunctional DNase/RNase
VEKIRLDILGLSASQSQLGSFALVLGDRVSGRRLPIIIGGFEAQAIALELEKIRPNRPMTHDLIVSISQTFDIQLVEVVISDLQDGVFFSRLVMERAGVVEEIDARPSDAIAVAVRFRVPIYTYENILNEAGIVVREDFERQAQSQIKNPAPKSAEEIESLNRQKDIRRQRLLQQLDEAIGREDYETAARIRDEIKKLEEEN